MKRLIALILSISALAPGCDLLQPEPSEPSAVAVTSVTIDQPAAEMLVGETIQLTATVLPANATDKTVTWSSSKPSVATVSDNGTVTAIAEGVSTITASAGSQYAVCKITVEKSVVPVDGISLSQTSVRIYVGDSLRLEATIEPENASDKSVTWSSTDLTIAAVSSDGTVLGVSKGAAVISAGAGGRSAFCTVIVEEATVPVSSVTLDRSELELKEGQSALLFATVMPENATDRTVKWESSDPSVASVDDAGKVFGVKKGTARITASAGGMSASCSVTVSEMPITGGNEGVPDGKPIKW